MRVPIKEAIGYRLWIGWFACERYTLRQFTTSRNWLALGGAVSSGSSKPQMPKNQRHMVNIDIEAYVVSLEEFISPGHSDTNPITSNRRNMK